MYHAQLQAFNKVSPDTSHPQACQGLQTET